MIPTYNIGVIDFQWFEYVLIPLILAIIFVVARLDISRNQSENEEYRYLMPALIFKLFAGTFFGLIYVFYYGGGDTISYYSSAVPLERVFWNSPSDYFNLLFTSSELNGNVMNTTYYNTFTMETGYPLSYISNSSLTFMVCKLTSPILILTGESFFATTLILSGICFIGNWKLFRTLNEIFPGLTKQMAWAALFVPSVLFWSGGIMKDTFTFFATAMAVSAFWQILNRRKIVLNLVLLLIWCWMILSIKPYILNILIPCFALWIFTSTYFRIKFFLLKVFIVPVALGMGVLGSYYILTSLGESMDKFSLDNAIQTAQITNDDLKREEQYGSNNFDAGDVDGSVSGLIAMFPKATFGGLYRPHIAEARSPVMLLSGIENLFLMVASLGAIFSLRPGRFMKLIRNYPMIVFCLVFSILFGFMLGVTTPNFGAMVRFKIPLIPFFVAGVFALWNHKILLNNLIPKNENISNSN